MCIRDRYRPKELQKYEYYGEDKTEVYWIHFTGSNVKNILRQYGFPAVSYTHLDVYKRQTTSALPMTAKT